MAAGWGAIDKPLAAGQKLLEPLPLFSKITVEKDDANAVFKGFEALNLKVGQIVEVQDHPNANSLLLMKVDIGRPVQIVAGLKAYYSAEELRGRKVVVVSNLKPAKLRGYESQGMLLAAEGGDLVTLLAPPADANPGDAVNSGMGQGEKAIEFKDFQKLTLRIGEVVGKDKVDIGRVVTCRCPDNSVSKKVAVFLPSPEAAEALAFFTDKGGPVEADRRLPNGATVR
jgi:methionyl-tRNA synthetase